MAQLHSERGVFIVGGGPAGLAAAIAARQRGFRVTVADCARPPIDKACGEGLMPDAVAALSRLGVRIGLDKAYPFPGIRFVEGRTTVEAEFPYGIGLGIRRTVLHEILVQRASDLGISIEWQTRVDDSCLRVVHSDDSGTRWIIGADGQNSPFRRLAGLDEPRYQHLRFGFRRHFQIKPWTSHVEVHWGTNSQMTITPVGPGEVCVALLTSDASLRVREAMAQFPEIEECLKGAPATTSERGAISALRSLKAVSRGPVALVGDASGSVDAITGDGLCLAFRQAPFLAEALAANDLGLYEKAHRRITRLPVIMSRLMLLMNSHAWFRRRVLRALARQPRVFSRLLAIHVGAASPASLGLEGVLKLGWQLLTA
jgi:flavin-dependent dehydrogenase